MKIVIVITTVVMALLLLMPLTMMFISSVRGPYLPFAVPQAEWTLSNYVELMGIGNQLWTTFAMTSVYVIGAMIISMVVGGFLAFLFIRTDVPGKAIILLLAVAPYVMPPIVRAQAMSLMLAPKTGILNQLLRTLPFFEGDTGPIDPFNFASIVVIQGLLSVTFPFMMLIPIFRNMDGSLEEAARTSGAKPLRVLRSITLPVLWPAILGVAVLEAIFILGALEVPLLFGQQSGGGLFSLRVYKLLTPATGGFPAYGLAAAYGVFFLIVTIAIFQIYRWSMRNAERRASVTGKGYRPGRMETGKWKYFYLVAAFIYFIPTAILPFIALAWRAFTPYAMEFSFPNLAEHFTTAAFEKVLVDGEFWASLGRTTILVLGASTISVVLAVVAAYVVARGKRGFATTALDMLASSSVAIPSAIAGFSAFLFFMVTNPVLGLNGTLLALMITYAYRITVSYRLTYGAVLQIGTELEEAAATSGASQLTRLRKIVLPLIAPTALATWFGLLILNAHEFTVAAFIAKPESRPLSLLLYNRIDPGSGMMYAPDQGAAIALLFTLMVFIVGFGLRYGVGAWMKIRAKRRNARTVTKAPVATAVGTDDGLTKSTTIPLV